MELSKVWVIVPAYNEGPVIRETVTGLRERFPNVLVVDDRSTDNTKESALAAGAHVCTHPINLGQGAALQTGIDYALLRDAEAIITFDADGQHSVADAEAMLTRLAAGDVEVVLASRFLGNTVGMPWPKRLLLKVATVYTKWTSGLTVTDTHNGLRCLSRKAASAIRIRQNRMAHASEILNTIGRLHLRYAEVPCTITYTPYSRAKGQRLGGAFRILYDLGVGRLYR